MAVTTVWYDRAILNAFGGNASDETPNIDFLSDTIKCALFDSSGAPSQSHEFYNAARTYMNECSGTGYTENGATLTGKTLTNTLRVTTFDAADVTWASSTITARYAVIYDATPATQATQPLLWYIDFGEDVTTVNGTFTITFAEGGIATVTVESAAAGHG